LRQPLVQGGQVVFGKMIIALTAVAAICFGCPNDRVCWRVWLLRLSIQTWQCTWPYGVTTFYAASTMLVGADWFGSVFGHPTAGAGVATKFAWRLSIRL
jgi:hypothetical protein